MARVRMAMGVSRLARAKVSHMHVLRKGWLEVKSTCGQVNHLYWARQFKIKLELIDIEVIV